eukprot:4617006-Amphidinium_carterae.1
MQHSLHQPRTLSQRSGGADVQSQTYLAYAWIDSEFVERIGLGLSPRAEVQKLIFNQAWSNCLDQPVHSTAFWGLPLVVTKVRSRALFLQKRSSVWRGSTTRWVLPHWVVQSSLSDQLRRSLILLT